MILTELRINERYCRHQYTVWMDVFPDVKDIALWTAKLFRHSAVTADLKL